MQSYKVFSFFVLKTACMVIFKLFISFLSQMCDFMLVSDFVSISDIEDENSSSLLFGFICKMYERFFENVENGSTDPENIDLNVVDHSKIEIKKNEPVDEIKIRDKHLIDHILIGILIVSIGVVAVLVISNKFQ